MRPDVVVILTDQERAAPRTRPTPSRVARPGAARSTWFAEHGVTFGRHYTGSLACAPSRPTLFTGQYPDVHGVTQTDGLGKDADDSGMRWLRPTEVPTLGHWFRTAGYDTCYQGKWHLSHADLHDAATGRFSIISVRNVMPRSIAIPMSVVSVWMPVTLALFPSRRGSP